MKKNEMDEQPSSVFLFALQSLVLREKKKKKNMKKKIEMKNENDKEEMKKLWIIELIMPWRVSKTS